MGGREDWGRNEEDLMRARGAVDEVLICMGLAPAHFDENLRTRVRAVAGEGMGSQWVTPGMAVAVTPGSHTLYGCLLAWQWGSLYRFCLLQLQPVLLPQRAVHLRGHRADASLLACCCLCLLLHVPSSSMGPRTCWL